MYDVIIVGAGPAGLFSALEFADHGRLSVLLIDKGYNIEARTCPSNKTGIKCLKTCDPCSQMCGFGGAGAFSDGKLNIAQTTLGDVRIKNYFSLEDFQRLVKKVDDIWLQYGAPTKVFGDDETVEEIFTKCENAGLEFLASRIRHLGTECAQSCLIAMQNYLKNKVEFKFNTEVESLIVEDNSVKGVKILNGEELFAKYVIVCPGREGAYWFARECQKLNIEMETHPVDLGVRVEIPASVMEDLTNILYEPKIFHKPNPFRDQVRTFCVCPHGQVTVESINGPYKISSVNGHSFKDKKTNNTNFALLVKTKFTEPFNQPTLYASHIAHLANLLSGGVLIQRLGDLIIGRRSTESRIKESNLNPTLKSAVAGDLSLAMPHRHLTNIIETLRAMDKVMPGVFSLTDTFLYGVEVKFYSSSPKLNDRLEISTVKNLFVGGDGVGISRNLVHASVCGLKTAEEIIKINN